MPIKFVFWIRLKRWGGEKECEIMSLVYRLEIRLSLSKKENTINEFSGNWST
jgi:hypothetical protein